MTENRLHQAQVMCLRFRQLTHAYGVIPNGPRDSSSTQPPTTWRSEWQPKRYPLSSTTLTVSTSVPTPMPNDTEPSPLANHSAFQTSYARMKRTIIEMK